MATFSDVVEQLKANNRSEAGRDSIHTREMRLTRETLENLIDEKEALLIGLILPLYKNWFNHG